MNSNISIYARRNTHKQLRRSVLLSFFLTLGSAFSGHALPAFPGAEGYGSETPGGRGGKVFVVTNLNSTGTGSLGEAIGAKGPRIVVFGVSGTIRSAFSIKNPFITIAGQTAPGDGICLKELHIFTSDVVVRYVRIRRGEQSAKDVMDIGEGAKNVIVDHCTISWGGDETLNTWHGSYDITIQWCMITECLNFANHAYAASLGGVNASYHHNFLAHCTARNPSIAGNNEYQTINMDWRNNVVYNFRHRTCDGKPNNVNIVNNYYKPGPASSMKYFAKIDEAGAYSKIPTTSWYVAGNYWHGNEEITRNNHAGVTGATKWLVNEPGPFAPVTTDPPELAYEKVLDHAGASLPRRDVLDARIIEEAKNGTATYGNNGIIKSISEVGGYPELKSKPALTDTDKDGMPDGWESAKGLNPNDASDASKDRDSDGYTNIEEYVNGLVKNTFTRLKREKRSLSPMFNHGLKLKRLSKNRGRITISEFDDEFKIFRWDGQLVFRGLIENGQSEVNTRFWPAGVYFVRVGNHTRKWIQIAQ